ncbi:MAG: carbohydrate ABC transporter permease [Bifidobacteriaceae bacterium]|jgi:multiple sugar transport system permease protein|nr:carbohydrate ABC transporter permease [Bifidobacteriaceae bacterium]
MTGSAAPRAHKHRRRKPLTLALGYLALTVLATMAIGPIIWAISGSFKSPGEVFVTPPQLIPSSFNLDNYAKVFEFIPLGRQLFNTLLYAAAVTTGQVFFCALAGYAFARKKFYGRDKVFLAYLATLMVPATVVIIPQFMLMRSLGWVDTIAAMIIPGLFGNAFGTYLMRQFFLSIPQELEEAARVDGANQWQVYWRIMLPLARPALAVLTVLSMITVWNDFLWPLVMIHNEDISTVTLGLLHLQGSYSTNFPVLMAASVMVILPPVIVYLFAQRAFVTGVAQAGLAGR